MHLIDLLSILLRGDSDPILLCWDSESCSGPDRQQTSKQWPWPFFWCKFDFGKFFGASSQSNHWAVHRWLYKIHFSLHITIQLRNGLSLLLPRIREDDTSKWFFFFFFLWSAHKVPASWAFSPFQFASNAKAVINVEFFSNFSCGCKRIYFDDPFNCLLSTSDGQLLHALYLQSFCLLCKTSWTVHSLAVPGPNALLMLWVFSAALRPILNSYKKVAQIRFLSNIISLV